MRLLAITSEPDAHLQFLQRHLGEEIWVFDPHQFPFDSNVTYEWDGRRFHVWSSGVDLTDCQAVWFRKPVLLRPSEIPVSDLYRNYAHSSYLKTIQALYGLLRDRIWVSDYWSIMRANNKLLQIEIARELGLLVPKTIVTSSPRDAEEFLQAMGPCVTKMMGTEHVADEGFSYVFYTTRIRPGENVNLSGLPLAPAMFQQEIPKVLDIRVTVVGEKCFACEIRQKGDKVGEVDWRLGIMDGNLDYSVHRELPEDIKQACVQMLKVLNLRFGAFDLVINPDGNYWFLEVNPNGQWGFVEEETGLPISNAMVEVLFPKQGG